MRPPTIQWHCRRAPEPSTFGSRIQMKSIATLALLYGHEVAPMGFTYSGQQPALVREEMSDVIYERNGQQYQLLDLLSDSYKTFKTVRAHAGGRPGGAKAGWTRPT